MSPARPIMGLVERTLRAAVLLAMLVLCLCGTEGCSTAGLPFRTYVVPLDAPAAQGLRGQFFGASTLLIRDDRNAILIDGFFSRPGWRELLEGVGKIHPDPDLIEQRLANVEDATINYVLVAHSHHDHAMDAPIVARMRQSTLVGSESTRQISCGLGCGDVPFQPAEGPLIAGDFTIRFFSTHHAPYPFEDAQGRSRDPLDPFRWWLERHLAGKIDHPLTPPVRITDYKVGHNYVFLIEHTQGKTLIVPSAGVPLDLGGAQADVVLLGIGDLDKLSNEHIRTYWKEAVEDTHARLVIPIHWDNFFRKLDDGLAPFPPVVDDVACAMETLTYFESHEAVAIRFMPLFRAVALDAGTARELGDQHETREMPDPFEKGCRAGRG
jgi:L-ascorbate metabolism protein UlaG (beta-lactamase superfamily)